MFKKVIDFETQGRKNEVLERHIDLTGSNKVQPWTNGEGMGYVKCILVGPD